MSWTEADWKQRNRVGSWLGSSMGLLIAGWIWLDNVYLNAAIGQFLSFCMMLVTVMLVSVIGSKILFSKLTPASVRMRELTRVQTRKVCWAATVGITGGFIVWFTLGEHWLTMFPLYVALVTVGPSIFRIQREFRQMQLAAKQAPEVASV